MTAESPTYYPQGKPQNQLEQLLANATAKLNYMAKERAIQSQKKSPALPALLISKPIQSSTPLHVGKQAELITARSVENGKKSHLPVTAQCETKLESITETLGDKWYNLPATEVTPELKNDLFMIHHRHVLDPKRHYKKMGGKNLVPKYFHVGRIIEPKHEFFSSRLTKKQRKGTLVDELLADHDRRQYFKSRAKTISLDKVKGSRKWFAIKNARRIHKKNNW